MRYRMTASARVVVFLLGCLSSIWVWAVEPIDINRASAAELQQLKGVGPVLAERIIALREASGGITRPEQLLEVRGLGEKFLQDNQEVILISVTTD